VQNLTRSLHNYNPSQRSLSIEKTEISSLKTPPPPVELSGRQKRLHDADEMVTIL